MMIISNRTWKVGSQDILRHVADYKKDSSYIVSHVDWSGSRILLSSYDIVKSNFVLKYVNNSEEQKFYLHYFGKVGHTILQTLIPLAWIIKSMPDIKLIINISEYEDMKNKAQKLNLSNLQSFNYAQTYYDLFFEMLKFYNMDYELVNCDYTKKEIMQVKNFYTLNHSPLRSSMIDSFLQIIDEMYPEAKDVTPTKKVYLSRQKTWIPNYNNMPANIPEDEEDEYYFRILREKRLEAFLSENEYEIVCAEDFKSFKEQLMFMASVKELMSVTSSGLNNMLFMHTGQTIIELYTTMNLSNPNDPEEHLHDHYHALSFYRQMTHVSLPLENKDADWIINKIKTNTFLKGVLND